MSTIKSFTDIPQSKKLAEILPLESADQTWERVAIAGANLDVPEELQYRHNGDMPFQYYSGIGIPCWSLSALLGVLPKNLDIGRPILAINYRGYYWVSYFDEYMKENFHLKKIYDNPIDACVDMIEHLHELKML